eukprot:TRINITY_DN146_c0_g1_i1.p1 TRINITY_DN146_c0_g1~~TRINITY_DN146_c0_g1_i1.p1  ORF type:complete len:355 (-),score=99.44 TRINITY_DN146_c0_g1_i1:183-1247(-)
MCIRDSINAEYMGIKQNKTTKKTTSKKQQKLEQTMRTAILLLALALSVANSQTIQLGTCTSPGFLGYILSPTTNGPAGAAAACPAGYTLADLAFAFPQSYPVNALSFLLACFGPGLFQVFVHGYNGADMGPGIPMVLTYDASVNTIYGVNPVNPNAPQIFYSLCQQGGGSVTPTTGTPCATPLKEDFEGSFNTNPAKLSFTSFTRTDAYTAANIFVHGPSQVTPGPFSSAGPRWIITSTTNDFGIPANAFSQITKPASAASFQVDKIWLACPFSPCSIVGKFYHVVGAPDSITFPNLGLNAQLFDLSTDIRAESLLKVEFYHNNLPFNVDDITWCQEIFSPHIHLSDFTQLINE